MGDPSTPTVTSSAWHCLTYTPLKAANTPPRPSPQAQVHTESPIPGQAPQHAEDGLWLVALYVCSDPAMGGVSPGVPGTPVRQCLHQCGVTT